MSDRLEHNKKTATDFYDLMFNQGKPAEAVRRHVGSVYVQHNPHVADGAAFARAQHDAIIKRVAEDLRPKYGQMYGYDASMPYNVELAIRLVGSYY